MPDQGQRNRRHRPGMGCASSAAPACPLPAARSAARLVRSWKSAGRDTVFDLPPTARYRLTRAPLAQALAQVRYPLQARLGTLAGIASVQERLAARYPYLGQQQIQSVEVQFSPESAPAAAVGADVNFTFTSDDGHAIVVTPGSATLTAGAQYQGME